MSIQLLREILINRRSIRKWKQDAVPRALVEDVITLATLAPSGNNQQNWSFIAVLNQELIQQMAESVLTKAKAITVEGMGTPWENQLKGWANSTVLFRQAPAVIAVYQAPYQSAADKFLAQVISTNPLLKEVRQARAIINSGLQSAVAALSYLLLAISETGLGAVWMTSPLIAQKELEEMLPSPPNTHLIALIAVGYPDEFPAPRPRKPISHVLQVIE